MPLMIIESGFGWLDVHLLLPIAEAHREGNSSVPYSQVQIISFVA
jgi:hypothetical protein